MRLKRGQSILEYSVLFAVIIAALLIMQVFIKRAYQGRLKREADTLGEQYSPGRTTSFSHVVSTSNSVTYSGGRSDTADNARLGLNGSERLIAEETDIEQGVSATVSKSASTMTSGQKIDSTASEKLYTK